MLNEVQRLTDSIDSISLKEGTVREDSKDLYKDVYRCDLDKPCVQYCVSDPSHCGVLVKGKLDKKLKGELEWVVISQVIYI